MYMNPPPPSLDESIVSRWVGFDRGGGRGRGWGGGWVKTLYLLVWDGSLTAGNPVIQTTLNGEGKGCESANHYLFLLSLKEI